MRIGVEYYPEQWDRSLWAQDAERMQEAGVQLVRMAEFAWSRLEPREDVFDFAWLDEVVELMASHGMEVVLCTPTHSPPMWLFEKHPDAMMTDQDGRRVPLGNRGKRCMNHPALRSRCQRIIEEMTRHYAGNKAVVAWQIDNEAPAQACACENCAAKFRNWMKARYGTLEAVNRAYRPVWSFDYSSWDQITPPRGNMPDNWRNHAYMLDYNRFTTENLNDFVHWQAEIIRRNCPGLPVTTNMWFCPRLPDWYSEFAPLDFMGFDNYPPTRLPSDPEECYSHAFHLDLIRGVKRAPFWVMEQLGGAPGGWGPMSPTPQPGMIKGYALQAFAHGADTVLFFRWRTCVSGHEMYWHGLIDHSNVPGRRFAEFSELCRLSGSLKEVRGARIRSDVAILNSFDSEYAFKLQPQTEGYYYFEQLQRLHRAFVSLGMNVDIISQNESLEGYRIVCAPEMYVTDMGVARRLHEFAERGGIVVLTTRSGVKDELNHAIMAPLPTVYRDMVGAWVEEYDPIGKQSVQVRFTDGTMVTGKQWCDILKAEGAEVLAAYDSEFYRGAPAITKNAFGRGTVYYIATVGCQALYDKLIRGIVKGAGLPFLPDLPPRVEVSTRTGGGLTTRFVFNNSDKAQTVRLEGKAISLAPFEMYIDHPQPA